MILVDLRGLDLRGLKSDLELVRAALEIRRSGGERKPARAFGAAAADLTSQKTRGQ